MPRLARLLALAAVVAGALVAVPVAGADVPTRQTLYRDGPDGRFLMGGRWLFRLDSADVGLQQRFMRETTTDGWAAVTVPNAWNLGDYSVESMNGSIGWYRKDFTLPEASGALDWIVRFESVNYRSRVWLNGRPIGENKGAYVPFELNLSGVKHHGTNHLVIRVDSRREPTDFPPSGKSVTTGIPTGGWWNYSGILREVYLRRVDGVDIRQVDVRPSLACGACDASVLVSARLDNPGSGSRRVHVSASFGSRRLDLGSAVVPGHGIRDVQTHFTLRNPRLWSPSRPYLYDVRLRASGHGASAGYSLHSGVRSIKVANGRLYLNGKPFVLRGVGYHEDTKEHGAAITDGDRDWLVSEAKAVGANIMRTHYPPHPYMYELADRKGMLLWSEIPVFQVKTQNLKLLAVRKQAARLLSRAITTNRNHPSVAVWSIGNELSSRPGATQGYYIRRAVKLAHTLDPTRPVGMASASYPTVGCHAAYAPLDIMGFNEYFGWYPGPGGQIFDRTKLSGFLDSMRKCYPDKAIVVTEFGAEANRDGPIEEKGTWAFQSDFINYHMSVFATKPWLSGTIYWALNEFRVRPGWDGGNPRPQPPLHQKGLLTYDRSRKASFYDLQQWFTTGHGPQPYIVPGQ